VRAKGCHDLNRLLDKPGPESDRASQKIYTWEVARLNFLLENRVRVSRFKCADAAAVARFGCQVS